MRTLIQNGNVYFGGKISPLDLLIEDGIIQCVGQSIGRYTTVDKIIEATGQLVTPGLVDTHVHYREPGFSYKETIQTGANAAARGGFTTVCAMANVKPVPDTPQKIEKMIANNQKYGCVHIKQYASITKNLNSDEVVDFKTLKESGAFGFSNDGLGIQSARTMYEAMQQAVMNNVPIVAHAEDRSLFGHGVMHEGQRAKELKLPGILGVSETSQIARDLALAKATGAHYHICHISMRDSIELVRQAKADGVRVTCEAAPHHLLLSDENIPENDGFYKMNPPLRTEEDRQALIEGLIDGTVDFIATDHAPHAIEEKQCDMKKAAFGITGSESAFALLYTHFVKSGRFTLTQLIQWLSEKPAQCFGLSDAGELYPGRCADVAFFDLEREVLLEAKDYQSKGINTPFTGQSVYGMASRTLVAGQTVFNCKSNN